MIQVKLAILSLIFLSISNFLYAVDTKRMVFFDVFVDPMIADTALKQEILTDVLEEKLTSNRAFEIIPRSVRDYNWKELNLTSEDCKDEACQLQFARSSLKVDYSTSLKIRQLSQENCFLSLKIVDTKTQANFLQKAKRNVPCDTENLLESTVELLSNVLPAEPEQPSIQNDSESSAKVAQIGLLPKVLLNSTADENLSMDSVETIYIALSAEAKGSSNPGLASNAWRNVSKLRDFPYKKEAQQRALDWQALHNHKKHEENLPIVSKKNDTENLTKIFGIKNYPFNKKEQLLLEYRSLYGLWPSYSLISKSNLPPSEKAKLTPELPKWVKISNKTNHPLRYHHNIVYFKDEYWSLGGRNKNDDFVQEIWKSKNGLDWVRVDSKAPFGKRFSHSSFVFKDKIWIIGGLNNNQLLGDIWNSSDGVNWKKVTSMAHFGQRMGHKIVEKNDELWLIGGATLAKNNEEYVLEDGPTIMNDVWKSADGINWEKIDTKTVFPGRISPSFTVLKDKFFVIGGENSSGLLNDVWESKNGIIWTRLAKEAAFSARVGHSTFVYEGALILFGGTDDNYPTDLWQSEDGKNWNRINPKLPFYRRHGHGFVQTKDDIFMFGGFNGSSLKNDLWTFKNQGLKK